LGKLSKNSSDQATSRFGICRFAKGTQESGSEYRRQEWKNLGVRRLARDRKKRGKGTSLQAEEERLGLYHKANPYGRGPLEGTQKKESASKGGKGCERRTMGDRCKETKLFEDDIN